MQEQTHRDVDEAHYLRTLTWDAAVDGPDSIIVGGQKVGRYHYWNDELRERQCLGSGCRTGCELVV